jgi:glucokinase
MTNQKREYLIGLDLGGTKIVAAVLDKDFNIIGRHKRKTRASKGADSVFERIIKTIDDACADAGVTREQLAGIGMGSPGPLNPYEGVIVHTPNLGFKDFPVRAMLEKEFDVPAVVDNDVNVGTYGEFHFGAAKGLQHVVGLFPGTGIGGGLVLDGKLYRGANGSAGEIGHVVIQPDGPLCGCGQRGCIEAIASKTAIAKEAAALVTRGKAPIIAEGAGTKLDNIRSGILSKAYASGDPDIKEVVHHAARFLGMAMANLVNIFNPEAIVLGGGVVEAMPEPFLEVSGGVMREQAMAYNCEGTKVLIAELGDDAVVFGGAKLIQEELERRQA